MRSVYEDKECILLKQHLKRCGAVKFYKAFKDNSISSLSDLSM